MIIRDLNFMNKISGYVLIIIYIIYIMFIEGF